ncbi:hypothetical protein SLEP1_g19038 [Rubroshorea leprosula]|nr:hypothetical protein SLEP1_g19038 [Rubroshorea leprosula]
MLGLFGLSLTFQAPYNLFSLHDIYCHSVLYFSPY